MIKLYTLSGILYQKIDYNENDITYNDLIKYIKKQKHPMIEELNFDKITDNKIFSKTIINLFDYNNTNNKINLSDEISVNELFIFIICKYHIISNSIVNGGETEWKLFTIENKFIKSNLIHEDPYQIIFFEENDKEYEKMCKIVVQFDVKLLQYINLEIFNNNICEEICKLAIEKDIDALKYIPSNLITKEMCKLAIEKDSYALKYIPSKLITKEIRKLSNHYREPDMIFTLPSCLEHYQRLLIEHYGDEYI